MGINFVKQSHQYFYMHHCHSIQMAGVWEIGYFDHLNQICNSANTNVKLLSHKWTQMVKTAKMVGKTTAMQ